MDERLVSISSTSPRSVLSLYLSFPGEGRIAIVDIRYEVTNLAKRQPSLARVYHTLMYEGSPHAALLAVWQYKTAP